MADISGQSSTSTANTPSHTSGSGRGRGQGSRGKSRGGLGKFLRARGRRGGGRPAVFTERLLLAGEGEQEEDEEAAAEKARKFSRREVGSNADRYAEPEPELDSDGEPIVEPEVDLSQFLERQNLSEGGPSLGEEIVEDDEDVDQSLSHISTKGRAAPVSRKGKIESIEWDSKLQELQREKLSAEATWDLKSRFRAKAPKLSSKPVIEIESKNEATYVEAPPLPVSSAAEAETAKKDPKKEMEDFLDDLLA